MKPFNRLQLEFMQACGQPRFSLASTLKSFDRGYANNPLLLSNVSLWRELIREEVNLELATNLTYLTQYNNRHSPPIADLIANIADDIGDSIYVLCGLANCLGIPLSYVFNEIHRCNMAKAVRQSDGSYKVMRREDGKILKPEGWRPPDIKALLALYLVEGEKWEEQEEM